MTRERFEEREPNSPSDEADRIEKCEEAIEFLKVKVQALEWAVGVTPGLAELDANFRAHLRDPDYRG